MIWLTMSGYVLAMRSELGTVIASTPLVDRARTRNVLPFRSSSIDATVTGALRKSLLRTGSSRIRSSSALLTRCAAEDDGSSARAIEAMPTATAADSSRIWRRDLFMAPGNRNRSERYVSFFRFAALLKKTLTIRPTLACAQPTRQFEFRWLHAPFDPLQRRQHARRA